MRLQCRVWVDTTPSQPQNPKPLNNPPNLQLHKGQSFRQDRPLLQDWPTGQELGSDEEQPKREACMQEGLGFGLGFSQGRGQGFTFI